CARGLFTGVATFPYGLDSW
nr:immunoglobulin heavy chain junction region [Macaca mulatta]MOW22443.1 immunoglobulin heavy chain junction region [Macaca mulatta]